MLSEISMTSFPCCAGQFFRTFYWMLLYIWFCNDKQILLVASVMRTCRILPINHPNKHCFRLCSNCKCPSVVMCSSLSLPYERAERVFYNTGVLQRWVCFICLVVTSELWHYERVQRSLPYMTTAIVAWGTAASVRLLPFRSNYDLCHDYQTMHTALAKSLCSIHCDSRAEPDMQCPTVTYRTWLYSF